MLGHQTISDTRRFPGTPAAGDADLVSSQNSTNREPEGWLGRLEGTGLIRVSGIGGIRNGDV
jgi:hypothetical protein